MSEDFSFETQPELVLPSHFDRGQSLLRVEIELTTKHAGSMLSIKTSEDRIKAIEAGRLLQQMTKNIEDFYKPIKQAIDAAKKPIRAAEVEDLNRVALVKDKLAHEVQRYEAAQLRLAAQLPETEIGPDGMPTPAMVESKPEKVKGEVRRVEWVAEVTDLKALVGAVAAGKVPMMAIEANQQWLNDRADSDREGFEMPGVLARRIENLHFRR